MASVDVVVIGAGALGSSIALELARRGMSVAVVDGKGGPGQGSTSASSAVMRFNFSTVDGVAAAWESCHAWQDWRSYLECDDDAGLARYHRAGFALLDCPASPVASAAKLFERVSVPFEEWDAEALRDRIPGIDPGRYWPPRPITDDRFWAQPVGQLGALFTPDAGFIDDPQLAAHNLATAAQSRGVEFLFSSLVTSVYSKGGRVEGVRISNGGTVSAGVVINAAGPWSSQVNKLAGVGTDFGLAVRPMRQEVHHIPAPPGFNLDGRAGPAIADLDLGIYLRGAPGNSMLIGGTEPECDPLQWLDDPDVADVNPTPPLFEAQVTRAARRFPELRVPNKVRGIAGVYDVSEDWAPIYDRTELDGYYVAMGTSGNQFKNAPIVGKLVAELVLLVESGQDYDNDSVKYVGQYTRRMIDIGAFTRRRTKRGRSTGTVMG
jgi:glycine/D-amino acid oxidase-like deaminating enzyme